MEQTPVAGAGNTNGSAAGSLEQSRLPEVNWSENGELRQLLQLGIVAFLCDHLLKKFIFRGSSHNLPGH